MQAPSRGRSPTFACSIPRNARTQAIPNAIEVTLALNDSVPSLPKDITASVAVDTLLSDKFILLSGGSSNSQSLTADTAFQGITPTTFDKLTRDIDAAIAGLRRIMSGTQGEAGDIFDRIRALLTDTQSLLTQAKPVLEDARSLTADARQLVATTKCQFRELSASLKRPPALWKARDQRRRVPNEKKSIRRSPTSSSARRT